MKQLYLVRSQQEFETYQAFSRKVQPALDSYLTYLREQYAVQNLPRAIVWTSAESASSSISNIPVPAYTNDFRTVFCPELEVWKKIYLRQLDRKDSGEIRAYYETKLSENHVLQILGHEFVHHSTLFLEDFEDDRDTGIWFEEGMCEYISRKYFLTDQEFDSEAHINALLAAQYGPFSLEAFGTATYQADYASIFVGYWRSFLAVRDLVARFNGNVLAVFREYHCWARSGSQETLAEWFHIEG